MLNDPDREAQLALLRLLREIRHEAGLRQKDLADRIGRSQSVVSKYESGELQMDLLTLRQICAACGTSLSCFVQRLEAYLSKS